jgi:hypothetical protein
MEYLLPEPPTTATVFAILNLLTGTLMFLEIIHISEALNEDGKLGNSPAWLWGEYL